MGVDVQSVILERVRELTVVPERIRGAATEIYYDTRLSGDDLWELLIGIRKQFGTDF